MPCLNVLHNDNIETHYECSRGWRIDPPTRTLIVHHPGGRLHIPLDNVRSIEVVYSERPDTMIDEHGKPVVDNRPVNVKSEDGATIVLTLNRWRQFTEWEQEQRKDKGRMHSLKCPDELHPHGDRCSPDCPTCKTLDNENL
jgi:hypothetical protein